MADPDAHFTRSLSRSGRSHLSSSRSLASSTPASSNQSLQVSASYSATRQDIRDGSLNLGNLALLKKDDLDRQAIRAKSPSVVTPSSAIPSSSRTHKMPDIVHSSPSGLSLLLNEKAVSPNIMSTSLRSSPESDTTIGHPSPKLDQTPTSPQLATRKKDKSNPMLRIQTSTFADERSPLLRTQRSQTNLVPTPAISPVHEQDPSHSSSKWQTVKERVLKPASIIAALRQKRAEGPLLTTQNWTAKRALDIVKEPVTVLPAVLLGILMNLLDGVSYGLIMFPTSSAIFSTFGGIGVSMFFVSCIMSQLVFSSFSIFKGGNGSMLIECVPFLHIMAFTITDFVGPDNAERVVATTMAAFALSSVLTGLVFFILGAARLGVLIEFFPRVVLVGCIGGVGAFLLITAIQVCAGLEEADLGFSWETIKMFFAADLLPLWTIPLGLAIFLRVLTSSRYNHPLLFPAFFLIVPAIFYIVVAARGLTIAELRQDRWVFDMGEAKQPWYTYLTLYDIRNTDWEALAATMPTQIALVFFALLHVPINLPALALSVGEDNVKTDRELVNHGFSNVLAGLMGTIPNYLCYVNSVLFYKVGGKSRLSSFMLAGATAIVLFIGPWVIGYLPVMVVGTLIYVLGYDLVKEAVWDTYGRVSHFEYTVIWIIVGIMTIFDFVIGILVGVLAACASFVIMSSQRESIRGPILDGTSASSTVRRHPKQSAFLRQVGSQIKIFKLQNFLFFGTVVKVEAKIRELLDATWQYQPVRFLILDFTLANGVDFSAAEAFLRIQRLLETKRVNLVMCGCAPDSNVGRALRNVDLWDNNNLVIVVATLNDALEHCENAQLKSLYYNDLDIKAPLSPTNDPGDIGIDSAIAIGALHQSTYSAIAGSPRRMHLMEAARGTFNSSNTSRSPKPATKATGDDKVERPTLLLMQALGPYTTELNYEFYEQISPYFLKHTLDEKTVLWNVGDTPDSWYVLELGILRATYDFPITQVVESMLPGTIAGEMSFLAGCQRNATVTVERDCIVWQMTKERFEDLEQEEGPEVAKALSVLLCRISSEQSDVMMNHLITNHH